MRVLFLDAYFQPEQIAFTHLENDLIEGLIQMGHEVEIVCPTPTRGVDADILRQYKKIKQEYLYNGHVHVRRFWAPNEGKNPFLRAMRYFWCNFRTFYIGKRSKGVDVVFSNSTPPTQGWIAGKVAKKLKVPFVYSLQDIFPDTLVNAEMTKVGSVIWKIGRMIENHTYREASKIITISDEFKDNIREKGVDISKIVVIPNWIDTVEVYPIKRENNKLMTKYGLETDKFYICYSGNIGHSQNLELLVRVAKEIQKSIEQIGFIIIGEGVEKERLQNMINEQKISNVRILPFQPYEDIAYVFSLGDVGLIISKPGIGSNSVPSKTWSILAAERPVLASFDSNSELSKLIRKLRCGFAVEAGKEDEMVETIKDIYARRFELDEYAKRGREYVVENLDKSRCVKMYVDILNGSFR